LNISQIRTKISNKYSLMNNTGTSFIAITPQ